MAKALFGALALTIIPSALAFSNTSPYFLFSTASLNLPNDDMDVAGELAVANRIASVLDKCPTKTTFVVTQHGVSSADFLDDRAAPRLGHALSGKDENIKSSMIVPEVFEQKGKMLRLGDRITSLCGGVVEVSFPALSSSERATELEQNDSRLAKIIADTAHPNDYTVIYITTPHTQERAKPAAEKPHTYEMEDPFGEAVQMELKRDLSSHRRAASRQERGLFEKYQYFSPGIFMAFFAIAPIFLIITVGLKALSSLEVSYFAFSKEMGPAAQRK